MKIVFFGPSPARSQSARHARTLYTLIEGLVDRGHHVVYFEREGDGFGHAFPFARIVRYTAWDAAREAIDAECEEASALVVTSGFVEGHAAVEWLLEANVPAHVYYELDPAETLEALEAEGAAAWVRGDQIAAFDLVLSAAGGASTETFKTKWHAEEAITLYEAIDTAVWHPRSPDSELACDLVLVADHHASSEATFTTYMLEAARALPNHRFIVAGKGWESPESWPDNVDLETASSADARAIFYSSARAVLVPIGAGSTDHAMPIELLEPTACGAACVVVDRPGLESLFVPGEEIFVAERATDVIPMLTTHGDAVLQRVGNLAEKRVLQDYTKLRAATRFEQRVARKFYRGHNG